MYDIMSQRVQSHSYLYNITNRAFFQDTAEKNAKMVFNQLDIDKDGELNEDEFVKGCLKVCFVQIEWKL